MTRVAGCGVEKNIYIIGQHQQYEDILLNKINL